MEEFRRLRAQGANTWNPAPSSAIADRGDGLLALRALTVLSAQLDALETTVVPVSTTPATALKTRHIREALRELIEGASQEIVVLGYELSETKVLRYLAERASAGVRIELLVDSNQTSVAAIRKAWPRGSASAHLWRTTVNRRGRPIRLHAKAIIVDGKRALLGSANFTTSGMQSNIELGVLLAGPAVRRIRAYAAELIARQLLVDAGEVLAEQTLGGEKITL